MDATIAIAGNPNSGKSSLFNLNMMDVAEKRGIRVDVRKLSELLEVPVTATASSSLF